MKSERRLVRKGVTVYDYFHGLMYTEPYSIPNRRTIELVQNLYDTMRLGHKKITHDTSKNLEKRITNMELRLLKQERLLKELEVEILNLENKPFVGRKERE